MTERADVIEAGAWEQASDQARAASATSGIEVAELGELGELDAAAALLDTVWGTRAGRAPISPDLLRAFSHTGNYVAGAFEHSDLVGVSVAFLANGGPTTKLHSHITGLLPGSQRKGIGLALKLHQRAWAIGHGLGVVSWTYDPLVRRNAYFNLTKLGAEADRFHVNFYGEMIDQVNVGDESDRCEVTWDLTSARVEAAAGGTVAEPDLDDLRSRGATVALDEGSDGSPQAHRLHGDLRLCRVPEDIAALRSSDPRCAHAWRLALRDTLGASLDEGFVANACTRSGWYVLERSP